MSHPLFGPEVRQMLQDGDAAGMRAFCEALHPATVAEVLAEGFTPEEVWQFLRPSDLRTQATVFEYFPATCSAPFVATLVDVTGLVIYFSVAAVILSGTLL